MASGRVRQAPGPSSGCRGSTPNPHRRGTTPLRRAVTGFRFLLLSQLSVRASRQRLAQGRSRGRSANAAWCGLHRPHGGSRSRGYRGTTRGCGRVLWQRLHTRCVLQEVACRRRLDGLCLCPLSMFTVLRCLAAAPYTSRAVVGVATPPAAEGWLEARFWPSSGGTVVAAVRLQRRNQVCVLYTAWAVWTGASGRRGSERRRCCGRGRCQ